MNSALRCEDPVLVIEHVDLYVASGPAPLEDLDYCIPFGRAKIRRRGSTLTILTYLNMVEVVLRLVEQLGVDAEVIDLRSLDRAGLDWATIEPSVAKTGSVLIVEQGPLGTSYGGLLAAEIQQRCLYYLEQPIERVHGGEASPSISKVLETAACAGPVEVEAGIRRVLANLGRAP
jgi:2-oxoisovalerate dehydrogenase E1 component